MGTVQEVQLRRAVLDDAEALAELAIRTFQETFGADTRPEDMALFLAQTYAPTQLRAEIAAPDSRTLLALAGGPIAFAQLRGGPVPACVTTSHPIELQRFYVDRPWHGHGVAQRLMQATLAEAVTMGARSVWLGVWERNDRAIAFYQKCGFVDVGTHEFVLGADVQTDRVMVLEQLPV